MRNIKEDEGEARVTREEFFHAIMLIIILRSHYRETLVIMSSQLGLE
jgi:hypothetical protein